MMDLYDYAIHRQQAMLREIDADRQARQLPHSGPATRVVLAQALRALAARLDGQAVGLAERAVQVAR